MVVVYLDETLDDGHVAGDGVGDLLGLLLAALAALLLPLLDLRLAHLVQGAAQGGQVLHQLPLLAAQVGLVQQPRESLSTTHVNDSHDTTRHARTVLR